MWRVIRANALCASLAACGCAVVAWLGLYGFAWNDYDNEARPAVDALIQGHFAAFLRLSPAYGGSLLERAPFALLPQLWGGGELAVYRLLAVPCLLAVAALGVWLVASMRSSGSPRLARAVALCVCVANPLAVRALELGHPEELLGASLCVFAVLIAASSASTPSGNSTIYRSRPLLAGALLGVAIANKEWALLAAGPVLLTLPARQRPICAGSAIAVALAVLAPFVSGSSSAFINATRATAAPPSPIFQPWQLWWFLGHHGALVHGAFGAPKLGYRVPPPVVGSVSHPLILVAGGLIPGVLWLQRRRLGSGEALLTLAVLLLLRCVLDTWDTAYYLLPFVFALLAWEVQAHGARPPLLAFASTVLAWLSFQSLAERISPDAQAAFFMAWTIPLAVWLCLRLFRGERTRASSTGDRWPGATCAQETTVSVFGRPVSTS